MALFLGSSDKVKINTKNGVCCLHIPSYAPVVSGITLISFDNHILKDSSGLYLKAKEDK